MFIDKLECGLLVVLYYPAGMGYEDNERRKTKFKGKDLSQTDFNKIVNFTLFLTTMMYVCQLVCAYLPK